MNDINIKEIKKQAFGIIDLFCQKYEMTFEHAVCDNPFDIILISDYYLDFTTILYCLENNIESELLFQWYDDNLQYQKHINILSYHTGLRHKDI
jgi:hypothetical protein